ncbi:hypothetical protein GE061_019716 [Apolygus lucorum]|uniref:Hornerin-like n=1 Tax=Apolygus lucorum TaxID=248454 RepID=A0A8S9X9E6_APOLU|nr:hypothetical protein GE061_019716 [Apolygus lucorum]
MHPEIVLVITLVLSSVNGEKATSYVSVSKGKEGGYSYEVIHDYPTKDSSASVHVFGDDDFGPTLPNYDYGAKIAADVAKIAADAAPPKKSSARGRGKKQQNFNNGQFQGSPVNDINSFGVIKHSATASGNVKPAGQVHSSTYVNIKHNMRAQSSGTSHLKSQGAASYSFDIGNNGFPKDNTFHGSQPADGGKTNPLDSGGGIHASASGPGFTFSDPSTLRGLSSDYGPVSGPIIYHHHHYHGESVKDDNFDQIPNDHQGFDFGKGYSGETNTKNEQFHQEGNSFGHTGPNHNAGSVGSISIEATLGHTCSTGEVTPLPHFHPRKPDDGFFNYAQDYSYGQGPSNQQDEFNGYDYPVPLQTFKPGHSPNTVHTGGKKGKWKPVIITSSKSKGKLHTFRISKDFKPGKLFGGFKPSFGPPGHYKAAAHLRAFSHDSLPGLDSPLGGHKTSIGGHNDRFANFHDAPFFDYDGILSSLGSDHPGGSNSFDDFPEYSEGGEKSLKDYHNSLYPQAQYRRGKSRRPSLSSRPIVVPPLKTTTVYSATTVTSPIPGVDVTSFLDSPSGLQDVAGRNFPLSSESDQATSYASPSNLSLRRNNKRKTG